MTTATKQPVLLTVLIETSALRWYVAGVTLDGTPLPLMCSEPGNLDDYVGQPFDEQVSFLRHRLSGVLQRGCDRLWGRACKPCQIVFVAEGRFRQSDAELTQQVADHFVLWMANPPVVFLVGEDGFLPAASLTTLAGEIEDAHQQAFQAALPQLLDATSQSELWELSVAPSK